MASDSLSFVRQLAQEQLVGRLPHLTVAAEQLVAGEGGTLVGTLGVEEGILGGEEGTLVEHKGDDIHM